MYTIFHLCVCLQARRVHQTPLHLSHLFSPPKCFLMEEWIRKMWYIRVYMYIYIYVYTYTYMHTVEYYTAEKITTA